MNSTLQHYLVIQYGERFEPRVSTSSFSDMLQSIAERGRALIDRTRDRRGVAEQRSANLAQLCEDLLSGRGEASGVALAIGLRHPDVYGAVFCASPGAGYRPPAVMPSPIPRAYLVAGTLEPFFLENATRWAVALRRAGADVVMTERAGSHGGAFWREEFPRMVAWAFGP